MKSLKELDTEAKKRMFCSQQESRNWMIYWMLRGIYQLLGERYK